MPKKKNAIKQTWVLRSLVREKEFRSSAKGRKEKEGKEVEIYRQTGRRLEAAIF